MQEVNGQTVLSIVSDKVLEKFRVKKRVKHPKIRKQSNENYKYISTNVIEIVIPFMMNKYLFTM